MLARVADQQKGKYRAEDRIANAKIERCGAQAVVGSDVTGEKRRYAYGKVSSKFIEAHRQAAGFRPNQIDFHNHGHRPGESLIDAEQRVGGNDPFPTRCPHHHEWHRQPEQPAMTSTRFRPQTSARWPETKLASALTTPKLAMKETTKVVEAILNSSEPISGTTVRSRPTMPPTNALIRTSRENCGQLARSPRLTRGAPSAALILRP